MEDPQQQSNEGKKGRGARDDDRQIKKPRRSSSPSRFPPQVLKAVAARHFLTTKELGRLVLLSSKALTASAFSSPEEVWKSLCCTHWGTEEGQALLQSMAPVLSAEQCFRKFAADVPPVYTEPRALRFKPSDYVVFVTVRDHEENQSIFCKAFPGPEIPEFFETGSLEIRLESMFARKTIGNIFDDPIQLALDFFIWSRKLFRDLELEFSVRILRYPDQKMIELVRRIKKGFKLAPLLDTSEILAGSKEAILGHWCYGEESLADPRMNATYGSFLFNRCFRSEECRKIEVDMDPNFHLVANRESENICDGAVGIVGFTVSTSFEDYCGQSWAVDKAVEGKNVTFAHFLEGLDGWFVP